MEVSVSCEDCKLNRSSIVSEGYSIVERCLRSVVEFESKDLPCLKLSSFILTYDSYV